MAEGNGIHDCLIIGAGPGGLQAAIYLGRFSRKALVLDGGGGRTRHARHIENFLGQPLITGRELLETGARQAASFGVEVSKTTALNVSKKDGLFETQTSDGGVIQSHFIIAASGVTDIIPKIENLYRFFGEGFYTCIDCDGYRTRGKKLVVLGGSEKALRLASAMKQMYTEDVSVILQGFRMPPEYEEEMRQEGINVVEGRAVRLLGEKNRLEQIELEGGRLLGCEAVMSSFGYTLNDGFLRGLPLKKDAQEFKYHTGRSFESSLPGLYITGPLTGDDQAVIAAGEGAIAALDINRRLVELYS